MPHLVAAPDKFRGTASARDVADAAARAARSCGWSASCVPMADGGEGLLEVVGGRPRIDVVTGPLGDPVEAEWRLIDDGDGDGDLTRGPTAVVEMSRASGRALVEPGTAGAARAPVDASTRGTGELIAAAVRAGARRVVVGCGGSVTTDGGEGAVEALGGPDALRGVELLVACDVDTAFLDAARVFGPQKGATDAQVTVLGKRLEIAADRYRSRFGVDVTTLSGAGAAGGLAGGLAALGGRLVAGFDLVAELVGLDRELARADLVVTGEGRFDTTSLAGKVVSGVTTRVAGRARVLVVAGTTLGVDAADLARASGTSPDLVEVVDLVERFGATLALGDTLRLVHDVVFEKACAMMACAEVQPGRSAQ